MKKPIIISLPHQHTKEEAKRRIRDGLDRLAPKLSGLGSIKADDWQGDELTFQMSVLKQEASGRLQVNDDAVVVEVYLPWMLHAIAERVRGHIQKTGSQILIEKK